MSQCYWAYGSVNSIIIIIQYWRTADWSIRQLLLLLFNIIPENQVIQLDWSVMITDIVIIKLFRIAGIIIITSITPARAAGLLLSNDYRCHRLVG